MMKMHIVYDDFDSICVEGCAQPFYVKMMETDQIVYIAR